MDFDSVEVEPVEVEPVEVVRKEIVMLRRSRKLVLQTLLVFAIGVSIGACGLKDEEDVAPGIEEAAAVAAADESTTTPPSTDMEAIVTGTYSGTLSTFSGTSNKGTITATVTMVNNTIYVTLDNGSLTPFMEFSLAGASTVVNNNCSNWFYSDTGQVGMVDNRQVWVTAACLRNYDTVNQELVLSIDALDYDYNSGGDWWWFFWESYSDSYEAPSWAIVSNLKKI